MKLWMIALLPLICVGFSNDRRRIQDEYKPFNDILGTFEMTKIQEKESTEEVDFDEKIYSICERPVRFHPFSEYEKIGEDEEACKCEMNEITCDDVLFEDATTLDTLMLKLDDKNFIPYTFRSRENYFYRLEKNKIIPSMAKTVNELDLSRNKVGKINDEAFYNFKNMSVLRLTNNNLAKIDRNIFKGAPEKKLHKLYLNQNRLTRLTGKPFSLLRNLKTLVLDNNKIQVTADLFEGLDNLEELSMDYCHLGDNNFDVNVFDKIPKLKFLSLRGNFFTEVPRAIQKLENLERIDLSETWITEFHQESFMADQSLKVLRAENMKYLWSLDDCAFCGLSALEEVYVSNSPVLWNINVNAFGFVKGEKARNMKKLDLSNCNVTTLFEKTLDWTNEYSYRNGMNDYGNLELLIAGNPINCTCDTAWLLEKEYYDFQQQDFIPKCKYPKNVEDQPLSSVRKSNVCEKFPKSFKAAFTPSYIVLLIGSAVCLILLIFISWKLINCLRSKSNENFRHAKFSQILDDKQPLEKDFQPKSQYI